MPVEIVEGWPDPQPMARAPRNGTHILVAFEGRTGYPPWTCVARWVIPTQRPGQPVGRKKMELLDKRGGYWATGWVGEKPCRAKPLGWWQVPRMEPGEVAE